MGKIIGFDNVVRHHFNIFLHDLVVKTTPNQTLNGK